ncbi:CU044_2847 family protein [Roseofilum casamattae]|uniref:CU044_2847 family protein n=1 Tax=Roseofilum casamattae BLCC-M143 TaxID=3022442 RepID=A0ABT7BZQ4_9CYAN|nr:CU044_2847 family protein [Roseofilum casamattae]MDJ1184651.1 CU044_2847 family protein [Roseofilum casamattae BLCC-M143]
MGQLVRFPLDDDEQSFVYMEVDETLAPPRPRTEGFAGVGDNAVQQAKQKLGDALSTLKPVANTIIQKVRELNQPADEVEVKFGVKMSTDFGVIIASGNAEVNYEITLKWKNNQENS